MPVPLMATPGSSSPVADACELAWRLLDENRDLNANLNFAALRATGTRVALHTRPTDNGLLDLVEWADRFGGALVGSTSTDALGMRWRTCRVAFEFLGDRVEVCALTPQPATAVRHA